MKNYKGVIVIQCNRKTCIEKKDSVDDGCMKCIHRKAEIVDLKGKSLFVFDKIKKKTLKKEK